MSAVQVKGLALRELNSAAVSTRPHLPPKLSALLGAAASRGGGPHFLNGAGRVRRPGLRKRGWTPGVVPRRFL
jgi:hypothetical protein